MLAIAKTLVDTGYEPERSFVFTSHTAEEYGRADSAFDWLIGAWWQISYQHPEWASDAALYVNIEGTGMACPTGVDSPPELRRFARSVLVRARRDGLLRHGNAWGVPRTGTEQWPFAAAGVPSLGLADQVDEYMRSAYHTQHDRIELVDPACLRDAVRLYARIVLAADRNPGALLDLAARPRRTSVDTVASPRSRSVVWSRRASKRRSTGTSTPRPGPSASRLRGARFPGSRLRSRASMPTTSRIFRIARRPTTPSS